MTALLPPLRRLLLCALTLGSCLFAQEPGAATSRQFHLTSIGVNSRDIRYLSPRTNRPFYLDVRPGHIAGPYALGSTTLPIYQFDAQGTQQPAAIATIPDSIIDPLVILLPGPVPGPDDTVLPYRALVLDYSTERSPANSIRFINVSAVPVAVAFGPNNPVVIPSGGQNIVPFTPPPPDDSYVPMKLAFAGRDGRWNRIPVGEPNDDIGLTENTRVVVLLNPDPRKANGGGFSAFTVITTPAPPPAPK